MAGKKTNLNTKMLLVFLLVTCLITTPYFTLRVNATTDISQNEAAQGQLQQKSDALNQQLAEASQKTAEQAAKQAELQDKMGVLQQQIDESNAQITQLDEEIAQKTEVMAATQAEVERNYDLLKQRLRAIYMAGETSTLDIILGATDFSDFMDKTEIVSIVSKHDTDLIQTLNTTIASVQAEKESVEQSRSEVTQRKTELDSQRAELAQLEAENQAILDQLQQQQDAVQEDLDQNNAELQSIEARIQEYYEEQQRLAEQANQQNGPQGNGDFIWPVPGYYYISSPFGDSDGRSGGHKGMDIAGGGIYGEPVLAAASGTVIDENTSSWGGGYGNYVMIGHGSTYITVYGHMSGKTVGVGDYVQQGQVIGYVGSTGQSTGPHLHFEIRVNNVCNNPMNWFN